MIKKLLNFIFRKKKNEVFIDKVLLDAVVNIAKNNKGNIIFLFSNHSYSNYSRSREVLSNYIDEHMQGYKQRLNGCDTTSSTVFNNLESDFAAVPKEIHMFDRLIKSVFTKNRAELDELASKCLTLDDVSVYIL